MPQLSDRVPPYRLHKQSGQAIVALGRDFLLRPHSTQANKTKYNRPVAECLANDQRPFSTGQTG